MARALLARTLVSIWVLLQVAQMIMVSAHPEEFTEVLSDVEIARREHLAKKRHIAARKCSSPIAASHSARRAKRALPAQIPLSGMKADANPFDSYEAPGDEIVTSYTCVTAPEIEEGPYYVNNEQVRQDLREDQKGITLHLDIGVIDTATCEPIPNALIEIWSANATGVYGAFETSGGGPPGGRFPHGGDDDEPSRPHPPTDDDPFPPRPPTDEDPHPPHPPTDGDPRPPWPPHRPGEPGGPRGPGGPGGSPSMSSSNSWLRGGYPTNDEGEVSLTTIYPGFYSGRTIHVHLMVHIGWEKAENGTFISHSGSVKHIGQLFFDEEWNDAVLKTAAYSDNKGHRTLNKDDHDFSRATIDGSSAIVQLEFLKDSVEDGLLGFITVGIDTDAEYTIHSHNYFNGSDSSAANVDF